MTNSPCSVGQLQLAVSDSTSCSKPADMVNSCHWQSCWVCMLHGSCVPDCAARMVLRQPPEHTANAYPGCVPAPCAMCVCPEQVAIKKVLQDKRFKNRELQIMKMVNHPNIVKLKQCFYSTTEKDETFLHLVLEYVPDTVRCELILKLWPMLCPFPMMFVKASLSTCWECMPLLAVLVYHSLASMCCGCRCTGSASRTPRTTSACRPSS